jgi:hypothetical protein
MNAKIKIYLDSGANITFLGSYRPYVILYQYPYDSGKHRPKKRKMELAIPSAVPWQYANVTWGEMNDTCENCCKSEIYDTIAKIIGKSNSEDILHIDSAYKSGCHIFLTSDKRDIHSKRLELEEICGFRIFFPKDDEQQIIACVEELLRPINSEDL